MSFTWGKNIRITIFGESHGKNVGIVIDGLDTGIKISHEKIREDLDRRRPGVVKGTTKRNEDDGYEIISGLFNGKTNGGPITVIFPNKDKRSKDYELIKDMPRPSHADWPAFVKYKGLNDYRGGGFFSARMTAPIVFAGSILREQLHKKGIYIASQVIKIGDLEAKSFSDYKTENILRIVKFGENELFYEDDFRKKALQVIEKASQNGDSIGAKVEGVILGLDAGVGEPYFSSIESLISSLIFSIPGVKAIEFGLGVGFSNSYGSKVNDQYNSEDGTVKTKTNYNGGILGGISTGMPIVCKVTFKPTPSISHEQSTVNLKTKEDCKIAIKGRHDSCIALRGAVIVEAVLAIVVSNLLY